MKYSYLPVTTQALYSEGGCRENAAKHHLVPYMSRDMVAYMFLNMVACMSPNLVAYMSLNMVAYMSQHGRLHVPTGSPTLNIVAYMFPPP